MKRYLRTTNFPSGQAGPGGCSPLSLLCVLVLVFVAPELLAETTLYVGKHFEVREHDQPTKYVFNGNVRVARVTGSLSTNTRIQRFRLHAGWNLLSLAVNATNLSDQLQSPGVVASAHSWNAQTGSYVAVPQVASSGTVLWVNATTNATLSVVGAYSDPVNREVSAGATYLSGTGLEAWTPNFPATLSVWHFSPQPVDSAPAPFGPWRSRLTGDLSAVNDLPQAFPPGQALYVINPAPFELEIPDPALRVRYYHQDHLGSSSAMTDANGALVEETAFYPFGIPRHEHRLRSVDESYKFSQKERDYESGLHYFEARFLAGWLARFMTQDPMYANPDALAPEDAADFLATPQKINTYAYARNNPLSYIDPTGLDEVEGIAPPQMEDERAWWDPLGITGVSESGSANYGMGALDGSQAIPFWGLIREEIVEANPGVIDPDSTGYKAGHWTGETVAIGITMFIPIPGPKGPAATPGTVTLYSKTPVAVPLVTSASISSRGGTGRIDPNTRIRMGNQDTVPFAEGPTLVPGSGGPRLQTQREMMMLDPEKARIIQRLDANRATIDRLNAEGKTAEASALLGKIFSGSH